MMPLGNILMPKWNLTTSEFSIIVFKSVIKPVDVVSQNISKRLSTGSVSITARYCKPGVSSLTIVRTLLKATVTGVATGTGGSESFAGRSP